MMGRWLGFKRPGAGWVYGVWYNRTIVLTNGGGGGWTPTLEDLEADDWQIVPIPEERRQPNLWDPARQ